jgi:alcohol dehydrogenase (cytochrome c)
MVRRQSLQALTVSNMKRLSLIVGGLILAGVLAVGAVYVFAPSWVLQFAPARVTIVGALGRSYLRTLFAPHGTTTTETNPAYRAAAAPAPPGSQAAPTAADDWPSYNKTLTSERFSPLAKIDTTNVRRLKVLCTYDTRIIGAFESGLLMVNGALIGTTEFDIFSINPETCALNWRTHENYPPAVLSVNRGAAYMDGMLYRGTQDGRVLAYDFATGKRIWATTIADPSKGESVPAAPIAWNGLVFIGNAGGDYKGGKGHIFALDGKTGNVVWEVFTVPRTPGDPVRGPLAPSPLDNSTWRNTPDAPISGGGSWTSYTLDPNAGLLYVPVGNPAPDFAIGVRQGQNLLTDAIVVLDAKTGAYRKHYKLLQDDWHDWDASNPPALIHTQAGRSLMAAAPKDGYLYGYDLADDRLLYRTPATRIENADEAFSPTKNVHFCPGAVGGEEWNSPAYNPQLNLIYVGDVDWCTTVRMQTDEELARVPAGQSWFGDRYINPFNSFGKQSRADGHWHGWLHAVDADTGVWKWRLQSNYPIVGGVTPTAGGVVFFGDVGGNFYAVDAASGAPLWGQKIGGAIGGGVITYAINGDQRVAVAAGFINPAWLVQVTTGKVVILGLR